MRFLEGIENNTNDLEDLIKRNFIQNVIVIIGALN